MQRYETLGGIKFIDIGAVGTNSIYYAMEIRTIIAFLGLR